MSKQITKATKSLKTSIDDYNKLECSTTCSLPHSLTFDSAKDPDSEVWLQVNAPGNSSTATIPATIRRKAIDLYYLMDRAREEITLLQSEMVNTIDHYTQQHQLLTSSLDDGLDDCSTEDRGRDILIRRKIWSIESYLVYLKALFESHIEDVSLPSLLFENDLPSLQQQEHTGSTESSASSSENELNLLSLPEREIGAVGECGSDSEDDDDLYEDQDSAFFSL